MATGKKGLKFKNEEYDIVSLLIYHYDTNLNHTFATGEVADYLSGEIFDITELFKVYKDYIYILLKNSSNFSSYQEQAKIKHIYENQIKNIKIMDLSSKLDNNTITLEEIEEWISLMPRNQRSQFCVAKYGDFITINGAKPKPKEMTRTDYSRFFELIYAMNYENILKYNNGKPITRQTLSEILEFKDVKSYDKFIATLKKFNMIIKTEKNSDGVSFMMLNPVYAMRQVKIDLTIYNYFKSDLYDLLSALERKYIELKGEQFKSSNSMIAVKD